MHTLLFTPPSIPLSPDDLLLTPQPSSTTSSLSFCGFCFSPSGVQMTLLVIAVKPTLWPVSTVCQFPLLSLRQTVLVSCVHVQCGADAVIRR